MGGVLLKGLTLLVLLLSLIRKIVLNINKIVCETNLSVFNTDFLITHISKIFALKT